jgi:hypothetical protein
MTALDLLIAAATGAALAACAPQMHGASPDAPPRPATGAPIDRAGRPLTGNALIGLLAPDEVGDRRKEQYNRAAPADWPSFAPDFEHALALYDGFDGTCGNQWLARPGAAAAGRYRRLALLLADDRLWIDSRAAACRRLFSVEQRALASPPQPADDCGGRTPNEDVVDVFRSLLVLGGRSGIDDGIAHDDREHSATEFPFLAAP